MATTRENKGTRTFNDTIKAYLEERAENDALFAVKFANPTKSVDDCVTYIINQVQKSGCNGFADDEIFGMAMCIILTHKSKWNYQQRMRARILFAKFPDLEIAYGLFLKLVDIFNEKSEPGVARLNLARWYNEVEAFGNNEFNKVLETFENHNVTIINYFQDRLTNASAESFNAKIKAFRTQFRGVGDIKFFMFRLATLYS